MPILSPSGSIANFLFSDLDNEVILKVENRVDDLSRADAWLRDALLEITGDPNFRNEFDQLEVYGSQFNLTARVQEYPETNLIPPGQLNQATLDINLWQNPPTNTIRRKLNPSHYQKADNFQPTFSLPTEWYRFGANIGFSPIPDKGYQVQTRMLMMHPINYANLAATAILIPQDWNEILVLAAAEKGFLELMEYEKSNKIHMLLHGDPKYPTRPGMMNGRKTRREQEFGRQEQPLRPIVRKIGWGT